MFNSINDLGFVIFVSGMGGLLVIATNLVNFLLLCEIVWVGVFYVCVVGGAGNDALLFVIWGLMFLCLATSESVVGFSLLLFKFSVDNSVNYGGEGVKSRGYSKF